MVDEERVPWTQAKRFEFMEWKLYWEGSLNRSDLEQQFEISTPQASVDLRRYRDLAEENIDYDMTAKSFVPGPTLLPRFLRPSADRLLLQFRALLSGALPRHDLWFKRLPPIAMAPDLAKSVDPGLLRTVLQAIRTRSAIEVSYQSLTNSRWRAIAPHALAFDGHRWHLRAWACDRGDFRDFVLSRISETGKATPARYDPADDVEWNTEVTMRLAPHPGLTAEQSLAVQLDFGMRDGVAEIQVRLSMAYYVIRRMNLDLPDLPPTRVQVCLANRAEVEGAILSARAEASKRLAARASDS